MKQINKKIVDGKLTFETVDVAETAKSDVDLAYEWRDGEDWATREERIKLFERSQGNDIPDNVDSGIYWKTR